jgi:D-xylose transport system permease protein
MSSVSSPTAAAPPDEPSPGASQAVEAPTAESTTADATVLGGNELVTGSFGEYVRSWLKKIRSGESGALPVVIGLIILIVIFQVENSHFLTAGNLTNLLEQSGTFVLLGMAEVFVLLLGEIDLSIGYMAGIGGTVTALLATDPINLNWFLAVLAGLAACAILGAVQGLLITQLRLPSFVVTLGGLLGFEGLLLFIIQNDSAATGGTISLNSKIINDIVNGSLPNAVGWIVMAAAVAVFGLFSVLREARRRAKGLVSTPWPVTALKIGALAIAGIIVVFVCNQNRGRALVVLEGVPWVVPLVLAVLVVWTILLGRTRFGRYVYAIGGNAEAARRAGVKLKKIRLASFTLAGVTAGLAGIVYLSQLGSISANVNGGNLVLQAVAAAVIGGVSLFGGRGKMVHAVLGGLVIATVYNGMGLLGLNAAEQFMVTALVLLAAVTVDAVSRRGRAAS